MLKYILRNIKTQFWGPKQTRIAEKTHTSLQSSVWTAAWFHFRKCIIIVIPTQTPNRQQSCRTFLKRDFVLDTCSEPSYRYSLQWLKSKLMFTGRCLFTNIKLEIQCTTPLLPSIMMFLLPFLNLTIEDEKVNDNKMEDISVFSKRNKSVKLFLTTSFTAKIPKSIMANSPQLSP